MKDAKAKIEIIRNKILNKEISFADVFAKSSSDEKKQK